MVRLRSEHVNWKSEYAALMSHIGLDPAASEKKRASPRFLLNPPEKILLVQVENNVGVVNDISAGGVSFFLGLPLTAKRKIKLKFDLRIEGKVELISTLLAEDEYKGFRSTYRNNAQFEQEDDGYRCMVLALRIASILPRMESQFMN